jgi:hypothetical protein
MSVADNTPEPKPKRLGGATGKGFMPGRSGNPSGKPKAAQEVIDLARSHTPEAIERLAHWMRSDDPRASVAACTALLDRAWGKPSQPIEAPAGGPALGIVIVPAKEREDAPTAVEPKLNGAAKEPQRLITTIPANI